MVAGNVSGREDRYGGANLATMDNNIQRERGKVYVCVCVLSEERMMEMD